MSTTARFAEAPLTLAEPTPPTLGLRDALGLWAGLGLSPLLPVAVASPGALQAHRTTR